MTKGSEEGREAGLGWFDAETIRFKFDGENAHLKVPHMGWNDVVPTGDHPLLRAGEAYFLHSYAFEGENTLATSDHGGILTAAIGLGNRIGVQFHPEKSQRYGLEFLARFLDWTP